METFENAYVASVYRRTRNLKKRLQKCVDYEALQSSGKPLDAGQREALQGKAGLEQNVADMESLLAQMREIALSEGEATRGDGQPGTLSAEVVMEEARKLAEMNLAAPAGNAKKTKKSTSVGVSTTSTFSTAALDDGLTRMEEQLRSLLRVFHVACRYSASTGKDLPVELEYFRDVALGSACPVGTSFADNLANSLRQVGLYLYVSACVPCVSPVSCASVCLPAWMFHLQLFGAPALLPVDSPLRRPGFRVDAALGTFLKTAYIFTDP